MAKVAVIPQAPAKKLAAKKALAPSSRGAPADYNKVAAIARMMTVQLQCSSFERKREASVSDKSQWAFALKSVMTECDYLAETGALYCVYRYQALCKSGRAKMVGVEADYLIGFQLEGDCNAESAKAYAAIIGRVAAYPHFRALFASLTSQGGLMLPPLPIMSEQPRKVDAVLRSFGDVTDRGQEELG